MRFLPIFVSGLATSAIAAGAFQLAHRFFLSDEIERVAGRLAVYETSVVAEVGRYSHLTHILARDPFVLDTAQGANTALLNERFEEFSELAALEAIYLMDLTGSTIAASNYNSDASFVGQNYAFRPYFRTALAGEQGQFYAIGATTGKPGFFIADPVHDRAQTVAGVVAIKIDFSGLEVSWRSSGEEIFLANKDGVVLLSSNPDWRYQVLTPLSDADRDRIGTVKQFPGQDLAALDWKTGGGNWSEISGERRLHAVSTNLPHGWTMHYFASDDQATARSWLATAVVVLAAGLALSYLQYQRALRTRRALIRAEREEVELRAANEQLAIEVVERKAAEQNLQRAQTDLERSSRLAALGQLSASVTHELGQPIAAMRNHLTAAEIEGESETILTRKLSGLVDRMEGITRELKFFATPGAEDLGAVDLNPAVIASVSLVTPTAQKFGLQISVNTTPDPVIVRGNKLRIEQVMTNILRNAVDATEDINRPEVSIRVGTSGRNQWFEVRDNGHGLGKATLTDLQEPFVTTRESGRGMGLGLAISANIIQDHGAAMTAEDLKTGGSVFRVTFPPSDMKGDATDGE